MCQNRTEIGRMLLASGRFRTESVILSHAIYSEFGYYLKTSNISHTLVGENIFYFSDVVGASPVGAASTTSSFSN